MEKTAQIRQKAEKVSLIIKKAGDLKDPETQEIIAKHQEITRKFKTFTDPQNERYITNIQIDATKTAIEHIFKIRDYRNAQVGGKQIFNNLSIGDADRIYRKLDDLPKQQNLKRMYFELCNKLIEDSKCHVTADSAKQFADILEIIQQTVSDRRTFENLSKNQIADGNAFLDAALNDNETIYQQIVTKINQMHNEVISTVYNNDQIKMATIETAIGHAMKHRSDFGDDTTVSNYLTICVDKLIQEKHLIGKTFSQDGRYINKFYGTHLENHYMCGITTTIDESTFLVTMFSKLFLGSRRLK
uniref:Uncharacterized protein n=1 Tax=Panagrolaimus sp. JU765 TaxID=591449 RepID=A0AC34Q265_9BILA